HKNGKLVGKEAEGTFFFDHSDSDRDELDARVDVEAVDGDGNHSPAVAAQVTTGEPRSYEALGDFSSTQHGPWAYEEAIEDGAHKLLTWEIGAYEGRWTVSALGRIGRIWMQPSAEYDLSRTFITPVAGIISA